MYSPDSGQQDKLFSDGKMNAERIKNMFGKSFDFIIREIKCGKHSIFILLLDGMCSEIKITENIIKPLTEELSDTLSSESITGEIKNRIFKGTQIKEAATFACTAASILSGELVIIADGEDKALCMGEQGYPKKAISEPQTEQNEKGSQEAFTDNFKDNATLLRRRLRTPSLVIEKRTYGKISNTPVLICYLSDKVSKELLDSVNSRLESVDLEAVFGSNCIRPFADNRKPSMFSDIGFTERPDSLSAKLLEGRIGIIADGSPFALVIPFLMIDYFHTVDDYLSHPYYAFFMRLLRLVCFWVTTTLPGTFVAICLFHPEIMPSDIMYDIATAVNKTPLPITFEALAIHFIYEIVREAGLRMPRSVGHAVTIVGALVIGDAAVTAGLIAAPMLIVVAITAITASVIEKLYEPISIMRFFFIIAGGLTGLYGMMLGMGLMLIDICSVSPYGIPFSAPLSPFSLSAQRDTVFRRTWKKLGKRTTLIQRMKFQ